MPYRVSIGDAMIDWRSLAKLGTIKLSRVDWESLDGQVFATLPEIDATLSLPHMLIGRAALRSITINGPRLFLIRDEAGIVRLGLEENRAILTLDQLMAPLLASDGSSAKSSSNTQLRLPFKRFAIEDAYMQMKDAKTGAMLVSSPFAIRAGRDRSGAYAALSMPFVMEEGKKASTTHYIDGSAQWSSNTGESVAHLQFEKMPGYLACMFTGCGPVKKLDGQFSGKLSLGFGKSFQLRSADIVLDTVDATLEVPEWFAEALEVKKGYVSARVTERGRHVVLNQMNLKLRDITLSATGNAVKRREGWAAQINAETGVVPIKKLYKYWPLGLAAESREWVITQITDGMARKANLSVSLQPQDFEQEFFPDHFLRSEIDAENLTINYLPGFPPIKGVNGKVIFTGETMDATTSTGTLLSGTSIAGSRIYIPDLNAAGTPMEANLKLAGPARDVAELLKLEHFPFEDALALNPETIGGDVEGHMKLGFDAFSGESDGEINFDKVTYDIDALLKGIQQKQLWGKLDLQALDGTLKANTERFEFHGTTTIEQTNMKLSATQDAGKSMHVTANGTLGKSQFAGIGLPDMPEVKSGVAGVDVALEVQSNDTFVKRADIDLTQLELEVPQITWKKAQGIKGKLSVRQLPEHAHAPHAYGIEVNADDLRASGEVATTSANEIALISIPKLETNLNDFSLRYEYKDEGNLVVLRGKRLDASGNYSQSENSILQNFPAIDLQVDLGEFVLSQTSPAKNVKGRLLCDKTRCNSAQFVGEMGNTDFVASIGMVEGKRRFELKSGDAGDFLRGLDITDRLYNGELTLSGDFDDTQNPAPLTARFMINKFNLKNSEVLGKILSVGSFTGLANTLTGQGIYFDKMAATMIAAGGKITIKDGKASGSSLGITIEGALDTATTVMAMKGVIVPANWINGFVGKIPIIGALAGGSGEGLVAFRYTVDGKYSDPDVSVNPLSGFTPGFLRNIFSIFDAPPPDELKDVQPESFPNEPPPQNTSPNRRKRN